MRADPIGAPVTTPAAAARTSLLWPAWSVYVGIALYLVSPHRGDYPAVIATIVSFGLFPLLFARARPLRGTPICPLNWVLLAFFLQLVLVPILVCFFSLALVSLPETPSKASMNVALLLSALAFATFCIGYHGLASRSSRSHDREPRPWPTSSRALVAVYLALGVVGLALTFHSAGSILGYFGGTLSSQTVASDSSEKVLGIVLRAFLGFGFVAAWCGWVDRRASRPGARVLRVTALAALAVAVSYAMFGYNRGAVVAPLVALLAVYGARVRRVKLRWLVVFGVIGLVLFAGFRVYRSSDVTLGQAINSGQVRHRIIKATNINEELQLYAGAPQFTAFLLERTDYGRHLHYGRTLIASTMSPVPSLGRPFRDSSGTTLFNRLVYGTSGTHDQIMPFQGELFINFQLPGVIIAYLLLGFVFQRLQRGFDRAPTSLQAFTWQYAATWVAYLVAGGVGPLSQIFVYFFWPIYALAVWSWVRHTAYRPGAWLRPSDYRPAGA